MNTQNLSLRSLPTTTEESRSGPSCSLCPCQTARPVDISVATSGTGFMCSCPANRSSRRHSRDVCSHTVGSPVEQKHTDSGPHLLCSSLQVVGL